MAIKGVRSVILIINLVFFAGVLFFLILFFFIKINFFVKAEGIMEPFDQTLVKSEVDGIIDVIYVEDGSSVVFGTELLKIKDIDINKDESVMLAEYNEASFLYDNAKILLEKNIISKKDFFAYEKKFNYAKINKESLLKYLIKSPIDGFVITSNELKLKRGDFLQKGDLIFKISELDKFIVRSNVLEKDINKIKVGQKAVIEIQGIPNSRGFYNGKVIKILQEGKIFDKQKVFEVILLLEESISPQKYMEHTKLYPMTGAKIKIVYDNSTFFDFLIKKRNK
jgi:multidrug resistance efflux pump